MGLGEATDPELRSAFKRINTDNSGTVNRQKIADRLRYLGKTEDVNRRLSAMLAHMAHMHKRTQPPHMCMHVQVRAFVRACVRACVRVCMHMHMQEVKAWESSMPDVEVSFPRFRDLLRPKKWRLNEKVSYANGTPEVCRNACTHMHG